MRVTAMVVGDEQPAIERSVASLRAAGEVDIEVRSAADTAPWSGIDADAVWLLRAGDRAVTGALATLTDALTTHPAVVGGHRLGCTGRWDTDVLPPSDPGRLVPAALAVDCTLELSSLAARIDALPAHVPVPPARPGGDVGLLCTLAALGLEPVVSVVAEVRCRPEHHGEPGAVLDRLAGTLASPIGDDPDHGRRLRRRALAVAYLDAPEGGPTLAPDQWWGPTVRSGDVARIIDVLVDLHWALGRSAEEAQLLRGGLDAFIDSAPADHVVSPEPDLSDLQSQLAFVHQQLQERLATTNWLHEEVIRRDGALAAATAAQEGLHRELARIDQEARDRLEAITAMDAELVRQNEEVARLHREVVLRDRRIELLTDELRTAHEALAAAPTPHSSRALPSTLRRATRRLPRARRRS